MCCIDGDRPFLRSVTAAAGMSSSRASHEPRQVMVSARVSACVCGHISETKAAVGIECQPRRTTTN